MTHKFITEELDAQADIKEDGAAVTLHRPTRIGPKHNPVVKTVPESGFAVITQYTGREVDGTNVRATDHKLLLSTEGITAAPEPEQKITTPLGDMKIIRSKTLAPAGVAIMYTVQGRL